MKTIKIIFAALGFLTIASCQEESLTPYDQTESGAAIYFPHAYNSAIVTANYDYFPFSFGYLTADVQDTVIGVVVATTGLLSNIDRVFGVEVGAESNMVEGVHFDFVGEPTIRANHAKDTLKIVLYRTADIQEEGVDLQLKLVPNTNFHTDIKSRIYAGKPYDILTYRIYADDISGQSYLWTTYAYASYVRSYYFGAYSKAKVDLMIRALAMAPAYFYDSSYESYWSTATLDQAASYMTNWLKLEKAEGREYKDENGVEIKMGSLY